MDINGYTHHPPGPIYSCFASAFMFITGHSQDFEDRLAVLKCAWHRVGVCGAHPSPETLWKMAYL